MGSTTMANGKVGIPVFLTVVAGSLAALLWYLEVAKLPYWVEPVRVVLFSVALGGIGSVAYCLRAVYLNISVHKRWSLDWLPWYLIRPVVGSIFGGISYVILKAGLLLLDAEESTGELNYGFMTLAFVAGFNVDRFVKRMEEAAKATFGIEPSRTASDSDLKR
jgi:hypothetical protein